MSAQPAEHPEDPLDPQWILRELPDRERANFLAAYREALDGARDPAGWGHLRRVLRLWSGVVIAANRPGFYEAQEAALTGTGGGMLLEDYIRPPPPPAVSAKLLHGDIAYVQLPGFYPGAADQVLQAITGLAASTKLRGVILDLRGNGGGSPAEVSSLLGAFTHGKAYAYDCDVPRKLHRNPHRHRRPAAAPAAGRADRPELRLGTLVGTRTAGIVAAPAAAYLLDDASLIILPAQHELSADRELINGIGVAPDYDVPLTAHDLSTGHDPDITKALTLLGG